MRSALRRSSILRGYLDRALSYSFRLALLRAEKRGTINADDKKLLLWITRDLNEEREKSMQGDRIIWKIKKLESDKRLEESRELRREKLRNHSASCERRYRVYYAFWYCCLFIMEYLMRGEQSWLIFILELIMRCIRRMVDYRRRCIMKWHFRNGPCRTDLIECLVEHKDICLICHEIHHLDDKVILSCGHIYGGSCLEPWIEVGNI